MAPRAEQELVLLCLLAVVTAWILCHTTYTVRYAHLYYRDDGDLGGLGFPGTEMPCLLDFAYYAFTIGMCFQVSDVTVTQHQMRQATLGHALLSFVFNTLVLALALNLLFGHLTPGRWERQRRSRRSQRAVGHGRGMVNGGARSSSPGHP